MCCHRDGRVLRAHPVTPLPPQFMTVKPEFCGKCGQLLVEKKGYGYDRLTGQRLRHLECPAITTAAASHITPPPGHDWWDEASGGGWKK